MTGGSSGRGPAAGRPLVVAAHGTASEEGRRVVEACAAAAAAELGVEHVVGYVDVCGPTLEEVLGGLARREAADGTARGPVVVPFFLASGYHVRHDVPGAVASVRDATVTPALGVEPEVLGALADRVLEAVVLRDGAACSGGPAARAGAPGPDAVVVTGAGSSVDSARAEVARVAELLGRRLGVVTGTAYLSGPGPRPEEEVGRLRGEGHQRVALAVHLLSPGHFLDRASQVASELGAVATAPLATHPALAALVVRRYREVPAG